MTVHADASWARQRAAPVSSRVEFDAIAFAFRQDVTCAQAQRVASEFLLHDIPFAKPRDRSFGDSARTRRSGTRSSPIVARTAISPSTATTHGWFYLKQLAEHERKTGVRVLDVLDVHL